APNGVGIFLAPGDGTAHQLEIPPSGDRARVFPGLHTTLKASAIDNADSPVSLSAGDVRWSTSTGSIDNGELAAPADAKGTIDVHATADSAATDEQVRVLDPLSEIDLS